MGRNYCSRVSGRPHRLNPALLTLILLGHHLYRQPRSTRLLGRGHRRIRYRLAGAPDQRGADEDG
jgi:hypothetical protein